MINHIISSIGQVLLFSLIPFLVFLIKKKTTKGFLEYIGLKKSNAQANLYGLLLVIFLVGPLLGLVVENEKFRAIILYPDSVTGRIRKLGVGV